MTDDRDSRGAGPTAERLLWLRSLERSLMEAEISTRRLGKAATDCPEIAMLLAQIQLARETLAHLHVADVTHDHPDWIELFRTLAEMADGGQTPWGISPPPPNSTI